MASAWTVSSSQDFGVEQYFWADDFWAVVPSPMTIIEDGTTASCFENSSMFKINISSNKWAEIFSCKEFPLDIEEVVC